MSRVSVDVEPAAPDQLILNQNFFAGWKARVRDAEGRASRRPVLPREGLIAVELQPGDRHVELYYLPDSFIWGAWISALAAAGCLGLCFAAKAGDRLTAAGGQAGRLQAFVQSPAIRLAAGTVALNLPWLLCHPAWPLLNFPVVRTLAVALVLLVLPGWPLVAAMVRRGWLAQESWAARIAVSMCLFVALIAALHVAGIAPKPATLWNATWVIANLGIGVFLRSRAAGHASMAPSGGYLAPAIFLAAFLLYAHAATSIVPPMDDHDFETQGTAYGLVHELAPKLLTDRHTTYYFAHPPLLHACIAGSLLYWNELDDLQFYDAAWKRNQAAAEGRLAEKPLEEFLRLPDGQLTAESPAPGASPGGELPTRHRIAGIEGSNYRMEPPLPSDGAGEIAANGPPNSVDNVEVQLLEDRYHHEPHALATRTPNVFFSALTVALLAVWIVRTTGRPWLAVLAAAVYATGPETLVRSSYGGYFAISQLAVMEILLAVEARGSRSSYADGAYINGLISGGFTALACHKLVFLPAAVFLCQAFRSDDASPLRRLLRAAAQPVVVGFALGTLLFWIYGLAISPSAFWQDHVRTHLLDRVAHYNPLGYQGYPDWAALWMEFTRHTGWLLLPLGIAAMAALGRQCRQPANHLTTGLRTLTPLWIVWSILLAIAFTLIDWRQTKHLCPLLLPLVMAPAAWAAGGRAARLVVVACLVVLLLWNFDAIRALAADFHSFHVSPDW